MDFEYDPNKSQINQQKHGINFESAQALWLDTKHIEIQARTQDEPRFMVIGKIDNKYWSGIITYRENRIRINRSAVHDQGKSHSMKASELDEKFDEDESVLEFFDLSSVRQPGLEQRRVNVDFPIWMIESLDKAAKKFGVSRQSVIKIWLAERLEKEQLT